MSFFRLIVRKRALRPPLPMKLILIGCIAVTSFAQLTNPSSPATPVGPNPAFDNTKCFRQKKLSFADPLLLQIYPT